MRPSWLAAMAVAAAPAGAAAAPLLWNCDTAEGSYSVLAQVQSGPGYRVSGTLTPRSVRRHRQYAPSAQVRLQSADEANAIALRWTSPRSDGAFDVYVAVTSGAGAEPVETPIGGQRLNQAMPFELTVSNTGEASLRVGVERRGFRAPLGSGARLEVICSTGEFEFDALDWGS